MHKGGQSQRSYMHRHLLNNKNGYCGVAPLQDNGITYNNPQSKHNRAFSSVFTHKDVSSMPVLTAMATYPNMPCRSIQFNFEGTYTPSFVRSQTKSSWA